MQLNGVHHIGINVQDLDRAEKFYAGVLGFKVTERYSEDIRHLMLNTGHTGLHLFESPDLNIQNATECLSGQGYTHIAFGTGRQDFPKIIGLLKKNNIVYHGPQILGKGESVHFKDPDGNHLEIRCPADLKSSL